MAQDVNIGVGLNFELTNANAQINQLAQKLADVGNKAQKEYKINVNAKDAINEVGKVETAVGKTQNALQQAAGGFSKIGDGLKGSLSTMLGFFGGAALTQGISGVANSVKDLISAGKQLDSVNKQWKLIFTTLGQSPEQAKQSIKEIKEESLKLANSFGMNKDEVEAYTQKTVALTGATGQQAITLTKTGLAIEKLSMGTVSAEMALKVFGKSASDPEAQEGLGRLAKAMPDLAAKMSLGKTAAEKLAIAQDYLKGTYKGLEDGAKGAGGSIQVAQNQIDVAKENVGQALTSLMAPLVSAFAQTITPIITYIAERIPLLVEKMQALKPIMFAIGGAIAVIATAVFGLNAVQLFAGWVSSATQFALSLLQKVVPSLVTTATAEGATGVATKLLSLNFEAMWTAATSGAALVIYGIIAVGAALTALYFNNKEFADQVDMIFGAIKDIFVGLWNGLVDGFKAAYEFLKPAIILLGDLLQGGLAVALTTLYGLFLAFWIILKEIGKFIIGEFIGWLNEWKKNFNDLWNNGIKPVKDGFDKLYNTIAEFLNQNQWLKTALIVIAGILTAPFGVAIYAAVKAIQFLVEGFQKAGSVGNMVKGLIAGISAAFKVFSDTLGTAWNALKSLDFKALADSFSGIGGKLKDAFVNGFDTEVIKNKTQQAAQDAGKAQEKAQKEANDRIAKLLEQGAQTYQDLNQKKSEQDGELTKVQIKNAKDAYNRILSIQSDKSASEEQKLQARSVAKELSSLYEKTKAAKSAGAKQEKEDILSIYNEQVKVNAKNLENLKYQEEIAAAAQGKTLTDEQQLKYSQIQLDNKKAELETLKKIVETKGGELKLDDKGLITIDWGKSKLDSDDKKKLAENIATASSEISKSTLATVQLSVKLKSEKEKLAADIAKINDEIEKSKLEADVKMGVKTDIDLTKYNIAQLQKEVEKASENVAKFSLISIDYDPEKLANAEKALNDAQIKLNEQNLALSKQTELAKINQIEDNYERERELAIFNAKQTATEKMRAAQGSQALEMAAYNEFLAAKQKAELDYIEKTQSIQQAAYKSMAQNIASAFKNFTLIETTGGQSDAAIRDKYAKQKEDLQKNLDSKVMSYKSYNEKIADINRQETEEVRKNGDNQINIWKQVSKAIGKAMTGMYESMIKLSDTYAEKATASFDKLSQAKQVLADKGIEANSKEINAALTAQKEYESNTTASLAAIAIANAAVFAQQVIEGKKMFKSFVKMTIQTVQAVVNLLMVQALANQTAIWGLAGFGTIVPILIGVNTALAAAMVFANKLNFEKGGINPFGGLFDKADKGGILRKNTIIEAAEGNRPEGVIKSSITARSWRDIESWNNSDLSFEEYAKRKYVNPMLFGIDKRLALIEAQRNTNTTSSVEKRLEAIEKAIIGTQFNRKIEVKTNANIEVNQKELFNVISNNNLRRLALA